MTNISSHDGQKTSYLLLFEDIQINCVIRASHTQQ